MAGLAPSSESGSSFDTFFPDLTLASFFGRSSDTSPFLLRDFFISSLPSPALAVRSALSVLPPFNVVSPFAKPCDCSLSRNAGVVILEYSGGSGVECATGSIG